MMVYTFNGSKYVTKGISETLPIEVQLFLLTCIDIMSMKVNGELDYLQVFKLETVSEENGKVLHIHHEQEMPEGKLDYMLPMDDNINCKIYIIDDIDHVTMLLAEEY